MKERASVMQASNVVGQSVTGRYDVAVVGAGILGLSHAYQAALRGLRTIVLDRSPYAQGASIRNFGMVWPIGQPAGKWHGVAMRSRAMWLDVCREADLWHEASGSVHLVTREDEAEVLREFARKAPGLGYEVEVWDAAECVRRSPVARRDAVIAGLYSASEICVDSPRAIAGFARWLGEKMGVEFRWSAPVTRVEMPAVHLGDGGVVEAARVYVCGGTDMEQLFPAAYASAGIRKCKLQMLAAAAQAGGMRMGPMVAGGLTLRHYENFAVCESLRAVKARVAREQPELDRYGIHVMASQHASGEFILGDSHEYDEAISPFDSEEIDRLIIEELRRFVELPDWRITRRWHGVYAKLSGKPVFTASPAEGVTVVTATGGSGMTMALGIAEQMWEKQL